VKLKLAAALTMEAEPALVATPRCHPDSAAFKREEVRAAHDDRPNWRRFVSFDALGWHFAERVQKEQLVVGDLLDIAYTVGHNDHPEYGGLELTLCDYKANR
jgi:hypothetical protein